MFFDTDESPRQRFYYKLPEEPPFGVPEEAVDEGLVEELPPENTQEQPDDQGRTAGPTVQDQIDRLRERGQRGPVSKSDGNLAQGEVGATGKNIATTAGEGLAKKEAAGAATKAVAGTATKAVAGATTKAVTGVATAGAKAATGPVGVFLAALQLGAQAWANREQISDALKGPFEAGIIILGAFGLFIILLTTTTDNSKNKIGGVDGGGRAPIPETNAAHAAGASGNRGLTVTLSVENLTKLENKLKALIVSSKLNLSSGAVAKANDLLSQMAALHPRMKTAAYAKDNTLMSGFIDQYGKLLGDLYATIYPNIGQERARVLSLIATGAIRETPVDQCNVKYDLESPSSPVNPDTFRVLGAMGEFAVSNGFSIGVNCVDTGHHPGTLHGAGRAVDIQTAGANDANAGKMLDWLVQQYQKDPSTFHLVELIYNAPVNGHPAGYYNIRSGQLTRKVWAGDHVGHYHVGVK